MGMALTKGDLRQIGQLLDRKMDDKLNNQEDRFERRLEEFRSDFFEKIDPVLKEVMASREERALIENRLEKLESIHPEGKHSAAS